MLFDYFRNIHFAYPWVFILGIMLPVLAVWYARSNNKRSASITVSTTAATGLSSWKSSMRHLPFILRLLCYACLIAALATPQTRNEEQNSDGEGIDIVLGIDVSGSMTAQDLQPNRLEAAKAVAIDFVMKRKSDRVGVVIFAGESFTQCPLTTDKQVLIAAIQNIRNGLLEDGTAIGSGLGTAVDRVRKGTSKSKIVVLLTDGENNGGLIDPITAKEIAKSFGIKVYTIGVGTDGVAETPVDNGFGVVMQRQKVSIDEKLLTQIAQETGGKYFRATDNNSLQGIYDTIDTLEKSKVEISNSVRYADKFFPFVLAALLFLLMEFMVKYLFLRKLP